MGPTEQMKDELLYFFADRQSVASIQRHYVKRFQEAGAKRVLDLGCGRGIFLELLREAGIAGCGVDSSAESVAECRSNGFDEVAQGDVLAFLEERAGEGATYDGLFCSHLVEHLQGNDATRLVALCARVLSPGGRLIMVTPNVANLEVWTRIFWLDPTHQRPYPRRLLEAMMKSAGLTVAASFNDRHTAQHYLGRDFYHLIPDLFRYGVSTFSGMDSVVMGDRPA